MRQQQLATQRLKDVKACTEQRSLRMTNFQMHTECISTFKRTNSSHIEELRQKKAFQCIANQNTNTHGACALTTYRAVCRLPHSTSFPHASSP